MLVAGRQPYRGVSRRFEHRAVRRGLHAIEADLGFQYLGRCPGWRNPPFDGLGGSSRAECHRRRRMERAPIQPFKHRRLASRRPTLRMAIPALQRPELDHSGGVQARRSSNARLDQSEDERPRRASLCRPALPHLRRPVLVRDHRPSVSDHKQRRQRMDRARGLEVLEARRPARKRQGLVLG